MWVGRAPWTPLELSGNSIAAACPHDRPARRAGCGAPAAGPLRARVGGRDVRRRQRRGRSRPEPGRRRMRRLSERRPGLLHPARRRRGGERTPGHRLRQLRRRRGAADNRRRWRDRDQLEPDDRGPRRPLDLHLARVSRARQRRPRLRHRGGLSGDPHPPRDPGRPGESQQRLLRRQHPERGHAPGRGQLDHRRQRLLGRRHLEQQRLADRPKKHRLGEQRRRTAAATPAESSTSAAMAARRRRSISRTPRSAATTRGSAAVCTATAMQATW